MYFKYWIHYKCNPALNLFGSHYIILYFGLTMIANDCNHLFIVINRPTLLKFLYISCIFHRTNISLHKVISSIIFR